uniref:5'-deoxynucleotidase n=1 Tax=Trepomonas sp. PC1 TaxID=1076344 RepID=A0A146KB63_9EUKA|eukprot:JAP93787.1 HD domain-containing protein [Trepomonas sp. PC1]
MNDFIQTIQTIYKLKDLNRTGWVHNNIKNPESIAAHSFGTALIAMFFSKKCGVNENTCIKMALIHDLQESIVGDYTPFCDITEEQKHQKEKDAAKILSIGLDNNEYLNLFNEYELNETDEARFVHDCDKLDMLLQAFFYENEQQIDLETFFSTCQLPKSFQPLIDVRKSIDLLRKK